MKQGIFIPVGFSDSYLICIRPSISGGKGLLKSISFKNAG